MDCILSGADNMFSWRAPVGVVYHLAWLATTLDGSVLMELLDVQSPV